jgi:hypothetical protein
MTPPPEGMALGFTCKANKRQEEATTAGNDHTTAVHAQQTALTPPVARLPPETSRGKNCEQTGTERTGTERTGQRTGELGQASTAGLVAAVDTWLSSMVSSGKVTSR